MDGTQRRTQVVVGAASGMGAAVADILAQRGPLIVANRIGTGSRSWPHASARKSRPWRAT